MRPMIPTEPIGSLPRPDALIEALANADCDDPRLESLYEDAIRDTIERFEATGSPVITDGERTFMEWTAEFDCAAEREAELVSNIGNGVFQGGFDALKRQFGG